MGLVDCKTEDEFEQEYLNVEQRWPQEFREWMLTTKGRVRSLKTLLKFVCSKQCAQLPDLVIPQTNGLTNALKQ